jgi:phospholipase/lecithinase/hemolysin
VGEYFVFNRGDALDWVHPNRAGHRLVAEYLLKNAASCL